MMRPGFTLFLAALLLQAPAVRSSPLDKASCERLKAEQGQLEQAGVRASMAKGPEWAKVNLAADKLDQVRRLIEVDAQVLFRCDGRPLVALPKEVEADPAALPAEAKTEGQEAATSKPDGAKASPVEKKAPQKKAAIVKEKAQPAAKAETKEAPARKAAAPPQAPAKVPTKAPAKQAKEAAAPPAADEAAKAKPKPKPKTKADDAYRPLSPDPGINPFANQLAPASRN